MPGKSYLNDKTYFKSNYSKALEYIVPKYLIYDDIKYFGEDVDIKDQIINSHIKVCENTSSILNVSALSGTVYSSINSFQGISKYFIKQNRLSDITPETFYNKILDRVEVAYSDFESSAAFKNYLDSTLLPSIVLNKPTSYFTKGEAGSSVHSYLIDNLSWLYFLNTSGVTYSVSSDISNLLANNLFFGKSIYLNDCLKLLSEYLWRNNLTSYYPSVFVSSNTQYTSGTQQLEKLKTWIDIIYSPLYADRSDYTVKTRFDIFRESALKINNKVPDGPFHKLLQVISLAAYDIDSGTEKLRSLTDIENCPEEYLPLLADLIGWKLFGSDTERWRLQLRNAVDIYKRAGTKKSIQFAVNSVFPKDVLNIESNIEELWESYVPYLIYYSLATESPYFKSNSTWTRELAEQMVVGGYSYSSIDENIRLATDRIILELYSVSSLSSSFSFPTNLSSYSYRGREYPVPPFEEIPYYQNVELSDEMILYIVDRLVCFGVSKPFADKVGDYIRSNTLNVDDQARSNGWLFFTSGYNDPPNISDIVANLNSRKFEYVSLWSGKSSHFSLDLLASDFDFSKKDEKEDTGDAVEIASQIVNEFAPAHSIPLVNLNLSAVDYTDLDAFLFQYLQIDKPELNDTSKQLSNYEVSALYVSSYKRNTGVGKDIQRSALQTLVSPELRTGIALSSVPRNTLRRRSYEKIIPILGYYDRTGFNMPTSFDPVSSLSGMILGFIPSSLTFQNIQNYSSIPDVYSICHDTSSPSSFYGYPMSSTIKCRGHVNLTYNDYYVDRGQLADVYATMHNLLEQRKLHEAKSSYPIPAVTSTLAYSNYLKQTKWKDIYTSYANSAMEVSGWSPNSVNEYYNFRFGNKLHKLYNLYTKEFNRHRLAEDLHYLDGANIFSHVYGPIIYNHDFNIVGSSNFIIDSLSSSDNVLDKTNLFKTYNTASGVYSSVAVFNDGYELFNSSIIDGIDLVSLSGYVGSNNFGVIKIPRSNQKIYSSDYMFERTFIKMTAGGNPYNQRLRIDISRKNLDQNIGYPLSSNFLLPDHKFKLNLNGLILNSDGTESGGSIGIWIHTQDEGGKFWSFDVNGNWVQHAKDISDIDKTRLIHSLNMPETSRQFSPATEFNKFKCIDVVTDRSNPVAPLYGLGEQDFYNLELEFDTYNSFCDYGEIKSTVADRNYSISYGQVHRKNQKYFIEVFSFAQPDRYSLIDEVRLMDMTMYEMATVPLKFNVCPESVAYLTKQQLNSIFDFWNDIAGKNHKVGYASRDSNETSAVMNSQGGSRLDYRLNSAWCSKSYQSSSRILTEVEVPV